MTIEKLFLSVGILALIFTFIRRWKNPLCNMFITFFQFFIGGVFIFSGFVKAIDPLGTAYKMHDYFTAFAADGFADFWYGLDKFNVAFSVSMIVLEIALGVAIIIGWQRKLTAWGLLAINIFFLILTGYSYLSGFCITKSAIIIPVLLFIGILSAALIPSFKIRWKGLLMFVVLIVGYLIFAKVSGNWSACDFDKNKMKVTDCGCFGDFMKLKPWVTFYKDIFLTLISLFLVLIHHRIKPLMNSFNNLVTFGSATLLAFFFSLYNFVWTLPVVDFRPYAVGKNIKEQMKNIKDPVSEFVFKMKNKSTGEIQEFKMENYPTDTIWEYQDRIEKVIEEGILAPINNLRITDKNNADITQNIISIVPKNYWIICWKVEKTEKEAWKTKIIPFIKKMKKEGTTVTVLLPSWNEEIEKMVGNDAQVFIADETALKTMIRSNPGVIELENSVVKKQWHWRIFKF